MTKAEHLLKLIEDHGSGEISSVDGDIPHYHSIERDGTGKVIDHGPANKGPVHTHPIFRRADGSVKLGPSLDDSGDTNHTHDVSGTKPKK